MRERHADFDEDPIDPEEVLVSYRSMDGKLVRTTKRLRFVDAAGGTVVDVEDSEVEQKRGAFNRKARRAFDSRAKHKKNPARRAAPGGVPLDASRSGEDRS